MENECTMFLRQVNRTRFEAWFGLACYENLIIYEVVLTVCESYYAVIEINSDTSLAEAVQLMSEHKVLSAPVVDLDAPKDASWIDRYIGIVEFVGIVVWILHQVRTPMHHYKHVEFLMLQCICYFSCYRYMVDSRSLTKS